MPINPVHKAYIVCGLPHILLTPEKSPAWQSLRNNYAQLAQEINESEADLILYFSTEWLSVIGYLFQADPNPKWTYVDPEWHELGSIPYQFKIDSDFATSYADEVRSLGLNARAISYQGFPIDGGSIVAQKLLNPQNQKLATMVSCNMYAEKEETLEIGRAALRVLNRCQKRAIVALASFYFFREWVRVPKEVAQSQGWFKVLKK